MASRFNGFFNNLVNGALSPKGNMADWTHASRLYLDDEFRLAPKQKFLYHVAFNLNERVIGKVMPNWDKKHGLEINMLVKTVDLPKYTIDVQTKNKYNRKKNLQTRIEYSPVTITFHDDNQGLSTQLWAAYYQYYYRDGTHGSRDGAGRPNQTARPYDRFNTYKGAEYNSDRFGFDNDSYEPFFTSIQVSQMARRQYTTYTLVNPLIQSWSHDTLDNSASAEPVANVMTVAYESVFYADGPVEAGNAPVGFAENHYDLTPSPISAGSSSSLFGSSGILAGGSSVLGDIASGRAGIGTLITAANTIKNAKNLTKEGVRNEAFQVTGRALGQAAGVNVSGLANSSFPKSGGTGTVVTAATPVLTKKEIKTLSPGDIQSAFNERPELQESLARKMFALGIISSTNQTPPPSFADGLTNFAALTSQERQALVDETKQLLDNEDLKTIQLASEVINTDKESVGQSVNIAAQKNPLGNT
jgi:hypothetical protein